MLSNRSSRFQLQAKLQIAPHERSEKLSAVPDTIEAEVLEIDGSPPPPPESRETRSTNGTGNPWDSLKGRVIRLDRRWWP